MGGEKGGITAIAMVTIIATILSVEGQFAQIDAGLAAGVRLGDFAEVFYDLSGDSGDRRIVVSRGEVVEVEETSSVLRIESEFTVLAGYSVQFELPYDRVSPLGVMDLARSSLEETSSSEVLRGLVDRMIPEDQQVEEQVMRLIEDRWRERGEYTTQSAAFDNQIDVETSAAAAHVTDMVDAVQAWADAWAGQRVEDYLDAYSREFQPPNGVGRIAWENQRRQRIRKPQFIRLKLVFEEARAAGDGWGLIRFRQSYWSNTFSDVVTKRLELVREDETWKIVHEVVEN